MITTMFSPAAADRPLADPAGDILGRASFAARVAAELAAWKGREQLIISLSGESGSGKTTLKNFIRHQLAHTAAAEQPLVVEFEAWRGPLPGNPVAGCCADIADQVARSEIHAGNTALAAAWRQLGTALTASNNADAGPAVADARAALRQHLASLPTPLILFVDDLDRVSPPEIQLFLRGLAANAACQNFICVLLLSRAGVAQALDDGVPGRGAETLGRLVQLELEMPAAPERLLRAQLERGLDGILNQVTFPARPADRWNDAFATAVWPWFSTLRDVKRFLSAFAFQFAGHFEPGQRVLEVNPIDLVMVELLRLFAHPVYVELRDTFGRRETRFVRLTSGRDEERKEARLEIDQLVDRLALSPREKRTVAATLQYLLPLGTGGAHGRREDWDRDLRLCSARHSERYFHFGAVGQALPAHRLIEIVRGTGSRATLEPLLLRATREGVLPEVLERLPALLDDLPEPHAAATASALSSLCDHLAADAPEDLENRLIRLAADLFARLQNPLRRENVLADLLDEASQLTGPILLLHQLRPRADASAGGAAASLSIEQFRRLTKPAVARLADCASDGRIWRSREYGSLIRRWCEWSASKDEVRQWLREQVKEPAHAQAWLRTFLAAPVPTQPRERVLQVEEISQFCDPAALAACATQAEGDGVERAAARTLSLALTPRGSAAGVTVRTLVVKLDLDAA